MSEQDVAEVWTGALSLLHANPDISPRQLAMVDLAKPMGILGGTMFLAVPHESARSYLEGAGRDVLVSAVSQVLERDIRIAIDINPELSCATLDGPSAALSVEAPVLTPVEPDTEQNPTGDPAASSSSSLNPRYVFDTFVTGSSNRFAHAACLAVAEGPAQSYNPLFIYGGSGLGKTHLLHAIGHYTHNLFPHVRVKYVSSETFTNDFINSIREGKQGAFQRRYRDVDVLLVDDIQFLGGKEQTHQEFFHTFNALHQSNRQVVITSDVPPKQLEGFEERMITRFEWGLITDVKPPELETRVAILRKKAATEKLPVPDEVLNYIGSKVTNNIRELEGALIRVTAFASLNEQPIDLSLAEIVLRDLLTDDDAAEVTPSLIIAQAASYFGLNIEDVTGKSRSRSLVAARHIGMFLCRELTDLSLPLIGKHFGGRDHTTVMNAYRKIEGQMKEQHSTFTQVAELTTRIKQQARQSS